LRADRVQTALSFLETRSGSVIEEPNADDMLVRRSQAGDRPAFEQLVRRTARLVYVRAYLDFADRHRAEDIVQETFLIAWRRIGQVTDPTGFRPWLLAVARTVGADVRRRESRKKRAAPFARATDVAIDAPDIAPTPAEAAEQHEQQSRMLELLRKLPEEYSQPLTLRYIAGADYETIGRQLGLTNGSLRGLLTRGMARLREAMSEK
jgi:RNA polymerase sigma-70 factor (ECF subfamily)